jgi:outer membrane protein
MEMSEEEAVIYRRVFDALSTYIAKMNTEKQYAMVLTTTGTPGSILYGDKALDITDAVVAGMNDEYIKQKTGK